MDPRALILLAGVVIVALLNVGLALLGQLGTALSLVLPAFYLLWSAAARR